jgi:gamma-glutamyltranspeptidase
MDMQEAIERPRFLIGALLPGDPSDTIHIEDRVGRGVLTALGRRGHRVKAAPKLFTKVGHAHGIEFRGGTMMGGADPRGDGAALGF